MAKKKPEIWLCRNKACDGYYSLWIGRPALTDTGYFFPVDGAVSLFVIHPSHLPAITPVRLRRGEARRVRGITINLEPVKRGTNSQRR